MPRGSIDEQTELIKIYNLLNQYLADLHNDIAAISGGGGGGSVDLTTVTDILGSLADAAAIGPVTNTDTIVAYLKQCVTDLEAIGSMSLTVAGVDSAANATTNEAVGNKEDAAVQVAGTTKSVIAYLKGIINALNGASGIASFPAAANPANGVSLASVMRAVLTSLVGGDDFDAWTNISNGAVVSLNAAIQKLAALFGADGANTFAPNIQGSARSELEAALGQLAAYFAAGGAAISSLVDPGGSTRTDLETILEDIGKILAGAGITTFPAAANPGNAVSMAAVLRAIVNSLVGSDTYTGYTAINNGAVTSLNAALQKIAFLFGADGSNVFAPQIQGSTRADLELALYTLATYFTALGGSYSSNLNGTARANVELVLEDIGDILCGATGITTYPAAANAGNNVSIAEVVRAILNSLMGDDDFDGWTNLSNAAVTSLDAALQKFAAALGIDGANAFNPAMFGGNPATVEAALAALSTALGAEFDGTPDLYDVVYTGVSSAGISANADGSLMERLEYVQTLLGYGARILTETTGDVNKVTFTATEVTEAAGWWKGAVLMGLTGHNIGIARPVITNGVGSVVVGVAFKENITIGDTAILISAYKPQVTEQQADTPVTITCTDDAETEVLKLDTAGYSFKVNSLRLKAADPSSDVITVYLYELVNDVLTAVDTFVINSGNFASYHSLVDMFGLDHLAGDNLKVTVKTTTGTGHIAITGQYQHSKVYTGTG